MGLGLVASCSSSGSSGADGAAPEQGAQQLDEDAHQQRGCGLDRCGREGGQSRQRGRSRLDAGGIGAGVVGAGGAGQRGAQLGGLAGLLQGLFRRVSAGRCSGGRGARRGAAAGRLGIAAGQHRPRSGCPAAGAGQRGGGIGRRLRRQGGELITQGLLLLAGLHGGGALVAGTLGGGAEEAGVAVQGDGHARHPHAASGGAAGDGGQDVSACGDGHGGGDDQRLVSAGRAAVEGADSRHAQPDRADDQRGGGGSGVMHRGASSRLVLAQQCGA